MTIIPSHYLITTIEFQDAVNKINSNKRLFQEYRSSGSKVQAVKDLKELTGLGLKQAKEVMDLYWENKIVDIREERKEKLERLAKKPLVEELVLKIKKIDEKQLNKILFKLSVDELLSLDEVFENEKNEVI